MHLPLRMSTQVMSTPACTLRLIVRRLHSQCHSPAAEPCVCIGTIAEIELQAISSMQCPLHSAGLAAPSAFLFLLRCLGSGFGLRFLLPPSSPAFAASFLAFGSQSKRSSCSKSLLGASLHVPGACHSSGMIYCRCVIRKSWCTVKAARVSQGVATRYTACRETAGICK